MGMSDYYFDEMAKEEARLEEQMFREREIIETREQIRKLLSRLDYDSLVRVEEGIKHEKSTRPEERYY